MLKFLTRRRTQEGTLREQFDRLVKAGAVADLSTADEGRLESLMVALAVTTDQLAADVETAKAERAVIAHARSLELTAAGAEQAEQAAADAFSAWALFVADGEAEQARAKKLGYLQSIFVAGEVSVGSTVELRKLIDGTGKLNREPEATRLHAAWQAAEAKHRVTQAAVKELALLRQQHPYVSAASH